MWTFTLKLVTCRFAAGLENVSTMTWAAYLFRVLYFFSRFGNIFFFIGNFEDLDFFRQNILKGKNRLLVINT